MEIQIHKPGHARGLSMFALTCSPLPTASSLLVLTSKTLEILDSTPTRESVPSLARNGGDGLVFPAYAAIRTISS